MPAWPMNAARTSHVSPPATADTTTMMSSATGSFRAASSTRRRAPSLAVRRVAFAHDTIERPIAPSAVRHAYQAG
jgi:hypothetical protein